MLCVETVTCQTHKKLMGRRSGFPEISFKRSSPPRSYWRPPELTPSSSILIRWLLSKARVEIFVFQRDSACDTAPSDFPPARTLAGFPGESHRGFVPSVGDGDL